VRDRVAPTVARAAAVTSKLVLVMVLVPVALAVTAQGASATTALADDDVAVRTVSFGFLGPVGIAAVALGAVGLVAGLLRHHRRREPAAVAAPAASVTAPLTAPVDAGPQPAAERVG